MNLREYQTDAITKLRQSFSAGKRRVILQATTGSGKTVIASDIIRRATEKGSKVLFLAHRRELVNQCSEKLKAFGVEHGVIMAGEQDEIWHAVQVASVQTLIRRLRKNPEWWKRHADIVFADECHVSVSPTFKEVFSSYPESRLIGLTATPCRGDGRGLGEVYEDMVQAISIGELIEKGFLVPMIYYAPELPDLAKVKVARGDYDQKQLGKAMNKTKLIGNVLDHWKRLAADRRTIVFASSVAHSKAIMHKFCISGIDAEHIDANTPLDERNEIIRRFRAGAIQVLCNCQVLTEGFDCPEVSCIVLARPTKSFGLYLQMAGRGMRPAENKTNVILIDHSGCVYEHGFVDEPVEWSLDGNEKAAKKAKPKERIKKPIECRECHFLFSGQLKCPACGWQAKAIGKDVEYYHADLAPVEKEKKASIEEKRRFYAMATVYSNRKGYKAGWVYWKYKEKFKCDPHHRVTNAPRVEPDAEFLSYMKHLCIKAARGKDGHQGSNAGSVASDI
jgi:DNA repair protein RadD